MARQIIILNNDKGPGGDPQLRCAFWLSTPAALVKVDSTRTSEVSLLATNPATAGELTAIQNGTITEVIYLGQAQPSATIGQIETFLQAQYSAAQTALNNKAPGHQYAGSSWDGTTWTLT